MALAGACESRRARALSTTRSLEDASVPNGAITAGLGMRESSRSANNEKRDTGARPSVPSAHEPPLLYGSPAGISFSQIANAPL
jgi:uncharacterized protein (DUF2345 family)